MRNLLLGLLVWATVVVAAACTKGGGAPEFEAAPELYEDSIRINPNPAWLYEKALFYFAFTDEDGDLDDASILVTFENDDGDTRIVEVQDLEIDGETAGTMTFEMTVRDGDEGLYTISIVDDAGNVSNEIEIYLFVNPEPREDENYFADDDDDLAPGTAESPDDLLG